MKDEALQKTLRNMRMGLPVVGGVVILVAMVNTFLPLEAWKGLLSGGLGVVGAALIGSVMAGNPITSYVLGGEMLLNGVSVGTVAAFILAWVTVGVVQFPGESALLGRRFALVRNVVSFLLAILGGLLVGAIL